MRQMVFDIETRPLPRERLEAWYPGGRKSLEKWVSDAPAHASTAQLLAIGTWDDDLNQVRIRGGEDERGMIEEFWCSFEAVKSNRGVITGFCIQGFDVPFLVRRSLILGVCLPDGLFQNRKYLSDTFVDLQLLYKMPLLYTFDDSPMNLRFLARAFNLGVNKMEGVEGDQFHLLWETNRKIALDYLRLDVETELALAERMGVVHV
jgi:hypothetical protein